MKYYADVLNHHVGYYAVFSSFDNQPLGDLLEVDIEVNEFGYLKGAQEAARKMNDYDEYSASLEQPAFRNPEDYNDGDIVSGPKTIMTHAERQEFHKSSPLFRKFYQ